MSLEGVKVRKNSGKNSTQFVLLTRKLLLITVGFIACTLPFSAQSANVNGLRDKRYCEILLSNQIIPREIAVYNTIGLNNCPSELWSKITPDKIKKETGASFVKLNGPRYWIIDGMKNSNLVNPKERVLGGIAMREAGVLNLRLIDLVFNLKPYREHKVHRETTWVYKSGKPVYEIVNPEGRVFIMQSYSIQKIEQTEASLSELGSKLHLPEHWTFRTRILKKDAYLTPVNEIAVVIQDEYLNTYQEETPDFISGSGS